MMYPEHPFITDADDLTAEQLLGKINELNTKLSSVYRMMNPNVYVINQIQMALNTYQTKYNEKLYKASQDDGFDEIIDVS